jgi:DNA-directed RNA polymerase specialized sigma24 family protein
MKNLNELYTAFISSPTESAMNDLLAAVRRRAAAVLKDEDLAQAFVVTLWADLISGTQPQDTNFSGWLNIRLRWAKADGQRAAKRDLEGQPVVAEDGDDEEVLSVLALEATGNENPYEHDPETLLARISDLAIHKVADRLLDGANLTQIAGELGITRNALYQKLWRYRQSEKEQLAEAA